MASTNTQYVCKECGRVHVKPAGKCVSCGAFGTVEPRVAQEAPPRQRGMLNIAQDTPRPVLIADVAVGRMTRIPVAVDEFSRVLGGGIVPGSSVLLGGEPGVGKSTLLLQIALGLSQGMPVLYASGEESIEQIRDRADRLVGGAPSGNLYLLGATNLEAILAEAANIRPGILIVDSVQTTWSGEFDSLSGSVTQVRGVAAKLTEYAKTTRVPVFMVGHVTKSGDLSGPGALEHIADTILHFEGDPSYMYRLLRASKNRFGPVSEVGVFEMAGDGLKEVPNPSGAFLSTTGSGLSGSSITATVEGVRPILLEIQSLTVPVPFANPRRIANGVDRNRMHVVVAVLARRAGFKLMESDVTVSVAGGMSVDEPAMDLPMALAVASSYKDIALPPGLVAFGEIGLSGELRPVPHADFRIREAIKMGFKTVLLPARTKYSPVSGIAVQACASLVDALAYVFPSAPSRSRHTP